MQPCSDVGDYELTEGELAYALRSTFQGTRLHRIHGALPSLVPGEGLQAKIIRIDFDELRQLNVPAIISTYAGPIRHASALLWLENGDVLVGEPLQGLLRMSRSEYIARWRWSGQAVIIAPDKARFSRA